MPERIIIQVGSPITLYDGLEEWKIIYEGTVTKIREITGTNIKRAICDPPMRLDSIEVD